MKLEISSIIDKCFKSSRSFTRSYCNDIIVIVSEEFLTETIDDLLAAITKNASKPVIVNGCLETLISILKKRYKTFTVKKVTKCLVQILESRDKQTRDLAKNVAAEICRNYGRVHVETFLNDLKPILQAELKTEFDKLSPLSTQLKDEVPSGEAVTVVEVEDAVEEEQTAEEISFVKVEILSKINLDFFDKLDGGRQERKDVLENLERMTNNKYFLSGSYKELVRKLCEVITKDTQVPSIILAASNLYNLAIGLQKNFSSYSLIVITACLEKFKEKRSTVVSVIRKCIDAAFENAKVESCIPALIEALANKNPSVKFETVDFLLRAIKRNKESREAMRKHVEPLMSMLRKLCEDGTPEVRDVTFNLIGHFISITSEKCVLKSLSELDSMKLNRIKAIADVLPKSEAPKTLSGTHIPIKKKNSAISVAPPTKSSVTPNKKSSITPKLMKSESMLDKNKVGRSGSLLKKTTSMRDIKSGSNRLNLSSRAKDGHYSESDAIEVANRLFQCDVVRSFSHNLWNERLQICDTIATYITNCAVDRSVFQAILVVLIQLKPGLKDSNVSVVRRKLQILESVLDQQDLDEKPLSLEWAVTELGEKMGHAKVGELARSVMSAMMRRALDAGSALTRLMQMAAGSKNIRAVQEITGWVRLFIWELTDDKIKIVSMRELVPALRTLLMSTNQSVKQNSIAIVGALYRLHGVSVRYLFDSERPVVLDMICREIERVDELVRKEKRQRDISATRSAIKRANIQEIQETSHKAQHEPVLEFVMEPVLENTLEPPPDLPIISENAVFEARIDIDPIIKGNSIDQRISLAPSCLDESEGRHDAKDEARSIVLELCNKMSVACDRYGRQVFLQDLRDMMVNVRDIGDENMKQNFSTLLCALNDTWIVRKSTAVQTEPELTPPLLSVKEEPVHRLTAESSNFNLTPVADENSHLPVNFINRRRRNRNRILEERNSFESIPMPQISLPDRNSTTEALKRISKILKTYDGTESICSISYQLQELLKETNNASPLLKKKIPIVCEKLIEVATNIYEQDKSDQSDFAELNYALVAVYTVFMEPSLPTLFEYSFFSSLHSLLYKLMGDLKNPKEEIQKELLLTVSKLLVQSTDVVQFGVVLQGQLLTIERYLQLPTSEDPLTDSPYTYLVVKNLCNRINKINYNPKDVLPELNLPGLMRQIATIFDQFHDHSTISNTKVFKAVKTLLNTLTKHTGLDLLDSFPRRTPKDTPLKLYIRKCWDRVCVQ